MKPFLLLTLLTPLICYKTHNPLSSLTVSDFHNYLSRGMGHQSPAESGLLILVQCCPIRFLREEKIGAYSSLLIEAFYEASRQDAELGKDW